MQPRSVAHAGPASALARHRRIRDAAVIAALAAATLLAFAPVLRNGFLVFDDASYLVGNPRVREGLTSAAVRWAFISLERANWHPLTWLSHLLDVELFGLRPAGHHAVSVVIHAANAGLLFAVFRAMTGAFWRSALVAALFALHPLRVESVAWASERKDVLTVLFGLCTLLCYQRYARRRSSPAYAATLALFACALMSKAMLVTLPALLLLLDFWPLNRWTRAGAGFSRPALPLVLEKLPFFALSAGAAVLALLAHRKVGAVAYTAEFPVGQRIGTAFNAAAAYLGMMVWPRDLAVIYPYSWEDLPRWQPFVAALLVAAATAGALFALRRHPALAAGWAWYLGTLVPVVGIVQVGSQSMADRYTLFPGIGIAVLVVWSLGEIAGRGGGTVKGTAVAVPLILAAFGAATAVQVTRWRTSETLFRHTVRVTRNNTAALSLLGLALWEQGRMAEGNEFIKESMAASAVNRAQVYARAGDRFADRGLKREAAEQYRKALEIRPYDQYVREKLRALEAGGSPGP